MEPPPLSAPPIATGAPPAPPQTTTVTSYADSVESSPRSRNTDSWDEPPYGPTATTNTNTTAAHPTSAATAAAKLRLMCSYGGHIVPRPHDKSLCYVGGDTRIILVDRQTTLSDLCLRLSKTLLSGKSFSLKYQLPNEDLDSLISVTTDEDLENMVDEYDRLNSSANPASKTSRLRLFIFSCNLDSETSSSIESLLENSSKSSEWFLNALNWNTTASCKVRGFSETSSINCLLGLDDAAASVENHSAVKDVSDAQLDASLSGKSEGGRSGKGINNNNNNNNLTSNVTNNGNVGQDVHSVPDSPMLETSSSFGSTSSSPSMANLPPIKVHSEEGINQKGMVGLGIEEQFSQLNVGVGLNNVQKQEEGGFVPPAVAAPGTVLSGLPVMVGGEYPNRVISDDERSEQGVPVGFRKAPQVQQYQQQVPQSQPQPQTTQFQQSKPIGVVDLPSPDSVSSDGSVTNPLSRQKPMMHHEPMVQIQPGNGRNPCNQIDLRAGDLNGRVPMPQHLQDSGYVLQSQFDQYQQLHQQQQFVPASNQYIHHHPGAVPMYYYSIYPPQQLGHTPGLEHQYPLHFMPSRQPQAYNLPLQQPSYGEPTPSAPSSRPQTPPAAMVPPTAFNPASNATTASKPEMTAGVYRTPAPAAPHMVQVPSSQTPQYAGYSQIHHPSQSIAPSSAATGNYSYEFADPTHAQIYYTQPLAPQLASAQYQTMTSAAQVKLPEASAQLPTESIKQQVRTTQL
ncbi:uncharacterized protein [Coffea arabica]|uniref:PB1 domain-containing protein n=1 Tax=Coffea arabica TaxID=13443 RepID=A0A6P6V536_COFAR|nr:probable basic-leucine zipper transcription factor N [Coffea arabica]